MRIPTLKLVAVVAAGAFALAGCASANGDQSTTPPIEPSASPSSPAAPLGDNIAACTAARADTQLWSAQVDKAQSPEQVARDLVQWRDALRADAEKASPDVAAKINEMADLVQSWTGKPETKDLTTYVELINQHCRGWVKN